MQQTAAWDTVCAPVAGTDCEGPLVCRPRFVPHAKDTKAQRVTQGHESASTRFDWARHPPGRNRMQPTSLRALRVRSSRADRAWGKLACLCCCVHVQTNLVTGDRRPTVPMGDRGAPELRTLRRGRAMERSARCSASHCVAARRALLQRVARCCNHTRCCNAPHAAVASGNPTLGTARADCRESASLDAVLAGLLAARAATNQVKIHIFFASGRHR